MAFTTAQVKQHIGKELAAFFEVEPPGNVSVATFTDAVNVVVDFLDETPTDLVAQTTTMLKVILNGRLNAVDAAFTGASGKPLNLKALAIAAATRLLQLETNGEL